jgi:hypothetical protein
MSRNKLKPERKYYMDKLKFSNEYDERTKQSEKRLLALMKATSDVIYRMSPDWKTMTEL